MNHRKSVEQARVFLRKEKALKNSSSIHKKVKIIKKTALKMTVIDRKSKEYCGDCDLANRFKF